jgi:hypothetical protein
VPFFTPRGGIFPPLANGSALLLPERQQAKQELKSAYASLRSRFRRRLTVLRTGFVVAALATATTAAAVDTTLAYVMRLVRRRDGMGRA